MSNCSNCSGCDQPDKQECDHIPNGITYAAPNKYKCKLCGERYTKP